MKDVDQNIFLKKRLFRHSGLPAHGMQYQQGWKDACFEPMKEYFGTTRSGKLSSFCFWELFLSFQRSQPVYDCLEFLVGPLERFFMTISVEIGFLSHESG